MSTEIFSYNKPFRLESGALLNEYHLAYTTLGKLNESKSNVVWIFHALTANSDPSEWWTGLVGEGKLFDPAKYFIVCVNMPGSAYGSIGPLDKNPLTGDPYYHEFPWFTTRDMIRAYDPLRKSLGIEKYFLVMATWWNNYWSGLLKNRNCLNILYQSQPMLFIHHGVLSIHHNVWLLKQIKHGKIKQMMRAVKD
jgi:hypothetical protein